MPELPGGIRRVTLPLPTRPGHVHAYLLSGDNGWIIVDGERTPIKARETIVVPADIPRGLEADTRMTLLVTHGA